MYTKGMSQKYVWVVQDRNRWVQGGDEISSGVYSENTDEIRL